MPDLTSPAVTRKRLIVSILLTVLTCSSSYGEIYKSTDEKGKVTFSDQPSPDADIVELPEPNTAAPVAVPPEPVADTPEKEELKEYQLSISNPTEGTLIPNGLLGFTVSARVSPALKQGHTIQLLINGKEYSRVASTQFQVASIPRGQHRLQLIAFDEQGRKMGASATISIRALRPSSAN